MPPFRTILRDAVIITVASTVVALAFNAARSENAIPLVATETYDIFVPCPEPLGDATAVPPAAMHVAGDRTLFVDARSAAEFAAWHVPEAVHVPFDWLDAVGEGQLRALVRTNAAAVVVYGDGGDPDSGHMLARELSGRGIRNVHYVTGGAPALQAAQEGGAQ